MTTSGSPSSGSIRADPPRVDGAAGRPVERREALADVRPTDEPALSVPSVATVAPSAESLSRPLDERVAVELVADGAAQRRRCRGRGRLAPAAARERRVVDGRAHRLARPSCARITPHVELIESIPVSALAITRTAGSSGAARSGGERSGCCGAEARGRDPHAQAGRRRAASASSPSIARIVPRAPSSSAWAPGRPPRAAPSAEAARGTARSACSASAQHAPTPRRAACRARAPRRPAGRRTALLRGLDAARGADLVPQRAELGARRGGLASRLSERPSRAPPRPTRGALDLGRGARGGRAGASARRPGQRQRRPPRARAAGRARRRRGARGRLARLARGCRDAQPLGSDPATHVRRPRGARPAAPRSGSRCEVPPASPARPPGRARAHACRGRRPSPRSPIAYEALAGCLQLDVPRRGRRPRLCGEASKQRLRERRALERSGAGGELVGQDEPLIGAQTSRRQRRSVARWPEKVGRPVSIDCWSPMSASTKSWRAAGIHDLRGGRSWGASREAAASPKRVGATVCRPVFVPAPAGGRAGGPRSRSIRTAVPIVEQQRLHVSLEREPRRRRRRGPRRAGARGSGAARGREIDRRGSPRRARRAGPARATSAERARAGSARPPHAQPRPASASR